MKLFGLTRLKLVVHWVRVSAFSAEIIADFNMGCSVAAEGILGCRGKKQASHDERRP